MDAQTTEHDTMLSPKQAGALIGRSSETVIRWIKQGLLRGVQVVRTLGGCRYRVPRRSVLEMIEPLDADEPRGPALPGTDAVLRRHGLA